jgi:hypothetical protein
LIWAINTNRLLRRQALVPECLKRLTSTSVGRK